MRKTNSQIIWPHHIDIFISFKLNSKIIISTNFHTWCTKVDTIIYIRKFAVREAFSCWELKREVLINKCFEKQENFELIYSKSLSLFFISTDDPGDNYQIYSYDHTTSTVQVRNSNSLSASFLPSFLPSFSLSLQRHRAGHILGTPEI